MNNAETSGSTSKQAVAKKKKKKEKNGGKNITGKRKREIGAFNKGDSKALERRRASGFHVSF